MKSNHKEICFTAVALAGIIFIQNPISAITDAKPTHAKVLTSKTKEANKSTEDDVKPTAGQDNLAKLAQAYQDRPDDNTYNALWESFSAFTQQQATKHKDPAHLYKNWKVLSQAGLKVTDPIGSNSATHIYTFNHLPQSAFVPQTKHGLIQWADQAPAPAAEREKRKSKRKTWTKKTPTITSIKTQFLNIPSSVDIREANLLPHAIATKNGKVAKGNGNSHHYLAILGTDLQSGYMWFLGLKQGSPGWIQSPELFQDVPSFLVQTNSAKTRFSGNTLVISLGGPNGYELVMPFTDDRFAFSTKEAQDSANAVARQFLMAIQYKRLDLAKVWLSDPKLASIPAYLGLFNRSADSPPLRLANMPAPLCGGSRFRLFTGTKDDLIIDVGKIKGQWLIKALFIAPANLGSSITSKTPPINNDPVKN